MAFQLKSQLQRGGFALTLAGGSVLAIGLALLLYDTWSFGSSHILATAMPKWWGAVTMDVWDYDEYPLTAWGTYATAVGLYLWLLHPYTLGRVWRWIRRGSKG